MINMPKRPKLKKEDEIVWFVRKYLSDREGVEMVANHLSPCDFYTIFIAMLHKGMTLTWEDSEDKTFWWSSQEMMKKYIPPLPRRKAMK